MHDIREEDERGVCPKCGATMLEDVRDRTKAKCYNPACPSNKSARIGEWHMMSEHERARIRNVMHRLGSLNTLSGDEMSELSKELHGVLLNTVPVEEPSAEEVTELATALKTTRLAQNMLKHAACAELKQFFTTTVRYGATWSGQELEWRTALAQILATHKVLE